MNREEIDCTFDVIIVGAGAAGCVLAGRLSEMPERRVLLIEAGPDAPAEEEHPDISDPYPLSLGNKRFFWSNLIAETGVDPGNGRPRTSRHYLQGFGVGGGSNINGMNAFRGQPADYNSWKDDGAAGWGWNDVLPYFNKLESDLDFSSPLHGDSGPIPMRRIKPADWAPFSKAVGRAIARRGYQLFDDYNADFRDGLSSMPISSLPDRRVSASMAYLTKSVRRRSNLTILTDAIVERLDIDERRVVGVSARIGTTTRLFSARETIVSCGALYSPALLMRSGIGPGETLRAAGVDVVCDLPGVGLNLQNHPQLVLAAYLPRASMQPPDQRAIGQNCLRYSSKMEGCADHDMGLIIINKSSWHSLGKRIGAIALCLYEPHSRGRVEIASSDPAISPRVRFELLSDEHDFDRMVSGARFALELLQDEEVVSARNEVFLPNAKSVSELNRRSRWSALQSAGAASLLETAFVRRAFLKKSIVNIDALSRSDQALRDFVRQRTGLSHHVSCTCKIGRADDPYAVVDSHCRVQGMDGLRVVDASVFPNIPRAGMHIPVLMAAEKMSDRIKADWRELSVGAAI